MGRAPCCDKANVKKGPWSPEEDATLKSYIEQHGTGGNWIALPQKIGLKRCGKSCRLRWLNYLRPNIKHGGFSEEEDNIICNLYISIGSRWSIIAAQLPGRTDNDIKNYWNTRLKKKLLGKQRKEQKARRMNANNQNHPETKKDRENYFISSTNYQNPYWLNNNQLHVLQPPIIPYSNEEPRQLNDHTSIRKLLMKLGGRFSDDNQQPTPSVQCSMDNNSLLSQLYQPQLSSVLDATNSTLPDTSQYTMVDPANVPVLGAVGGGGGGFVSELEKIVYSTPQKHEDGLEFLYEDIMMNARNGSSCGVINNTDWDGMSSLVFPLVGNNLDGDEHGGMIEEYAQQRII